MFCLNLSVALIFALALCRAGPVDAIKPGFKARITQPALDYANQQAINTVADMVTKTPIPDQSGHASGIDYSLTNIHITSFTKPSSSIKLVTNKGLTWTASNADLSLHSDWQVKYKKGWFKVSTSGSVDVTVSQLTFSTTMAFGIDKSGRPSISSAGCDCQVGDIDIDIHGDLSFVLNLFKHEVEDRVKEMIPGKLCGAVENVINNNAESQLAKLKVLAFLLDKKFQLDYRLVSAPSFQPAFLETEHKGEITWTAKPQPPPFDPPPIPPSTSASRMLYLWVSQYMPESFLYAAQEHGFLQYNLTTNDLPPGEKGFLNTTCTSLACIGNLVPMIGKKYPNCTVELRMKSTINPIVKMAPGVLEADLGGVIDFYAHTPKGEVPFLLTVKVSAVFNMSATVDDQLLKGNISGSSFQVAVVKSDVGPVSAKTLNVMIGVVMKFFIIPQINAKGMSGMPLPVAGDLKFHNTQLEIQQGALMIATDLSYSVKF